SVSGFEGLRWKNENEFYFTNRKGEWVYSINKKTFAKSDRQQSDNSLENLEEFKVGELFAYVDNNNVLIMKNSKNESFTHQVTTDGSYEIVNGKSVHRDEFGIRKGLFWSPNGN